MPKPLLIAAWATLLLVPLRSFAASETLATYLVGELERYEEALEHVPTACRSEKTPTELWKLQRFFLRIRPEISFTVGMISMEVMPDIELYWEREFPAGWEPYHP